MAQADKESLGVVGVLSTVASLTYVTPADMYELGK